MTALRQGLPELPPRMRSLPVDARGYPVPWFVAWLDAAGRAMPRGLGTPDFRVVHPGAPQMAFELRVCWLCGEPLGAHKSFVIGPMCAINRTSSEPPCHLECADFAARACPFLVRPNQRRNTHDMPAHQHAPGCMIQRNPGVTLVWTTKKFELRAIEGNPEYGIEPGLLVQIGDPEHVRWYREGREASRAEVIESIESGLPRLRELAVQERGGLSSSRSTRRARGSSSPSLSLPFHGEGSFE